ncbi:MAG: hypothetical protein RL136_661 [Planctomycetota bacterium]|jgi:hypothetical protein
MGRFPMRASAVCLAFSIACASPLASADEAGLARAFSWIPEDAVSFVAVPSLKALSNDIAQLVEATGQGGLLSMGRPIDVLKAQLGVGANLDENGPAVAYFPSVPLADIAATPRPVVVVPVTDGEAFLKANLTPAPDRGERAYTTSDGMEVHARILEGCVVLAPTSDTLPAEAPARGIGERFRGRLKPRETAWLGRADLVAWGSRDALHSAVERARREPLPVIPEAVPEGVPGAFGAQQEAARAKALEIADMLADGLVVVDVDPLGLFVAALGVAEPATALAAVMAGGEGPGARFDRLPDNPFYLALSADIDGLGGSARFGELMDLAGLPRTMLPDWVFAEGSDIAGLQLGAFPSKLGVAMGGALNDSALFLASRDPARTLQRIRSTVESLAGESAGIRREPSWTEGKKLKSGELADAFEIKETVFDAKQRPTLDYERLAKQFTFGARGFNGLARRTDRGVVLTFSQRPDVFDRAVRAAGGVDVLASDETVRSLEEWLPERRDVELMIGVGPLVNLAAQIASSFVSEEQVRGMLPAIERDATPVAVAAELGEGRAALVLVLPAEVLKAFTQAGARFGGAAGGTP